MGMDSRSQFDIMMMKSLGSIASRYTVLHEDGDFLRGSCPMHNDSAQHFVVDENNFTFNCEECGKNGTVIEFMKEIHGVSFIEAKHKLGGQAYYYPPDEDAEFIRTATETALALHLWRNGMPLLGEGHAVHVFMDRARTPSKLYHDDSCFRVQFIEYNGDGEEHETLLVAVRDSRGEFLGLQRI